MNPKNRALMLGSLIAVCCIALLSFSSNKGGDSFEIWLNGKQVLQQFIPVSKGIQTLRLSPASGNDKLDIFYSHCGRVGTGRNISVMDEKQRPVKVWTFPDALNNNVAMSVKVKDILGLRKNDADKLTLLYSSKELPTGRVLVTIVTSNEAGITRN